MENILKPVKKNTIKTYIKIFSRTAVSTVKFGLIFGDSFHDMLNIKAARPVPDGEMFTLSIQRQIYSATMAVAIHPTAGRQVM